MARLKRTAMGPSASDSSAIGDYFTLFKTMSPSYGEGDSHGPLTPSQHLALLPLATGAHLGALFLFMLVEVSGGAGGTSTVASTRSVLLVLVHALLLLMAIALSQRARGGLQTSNAVSLVSSVQGRRSTALKLLRWVADTDGGNLSQLLAFAILSAVGLAASLGSSLSTFGVESCASGEVTFLSYSARLACTVLAGLLHRRLPAPLDLWLCVGVLGTRARRPPGSYAQKWSLNLTGVIVKQGQAARCGLSSARRGVKMVFEFTFSLVLGLPPLLAAVSVLATHRPGLVRIAAPQARPLSRATS